ncbi:hypothetical protein [Chryseobacterium sp. SIMBA_038]|uniref:hypothetical protein n=1 Tax=Chryseobacterium sp. SIMBA_038 TaxID=3085780 RepID=UPI00397D100C
MNRYITGLFFMMSVMIFSQVGINTNNPNLNSDLELASMNKALYLNRVANPENDILNPQLGMMLYDITMNCVRVYKGDPAAWSGCLRGTAVPGTVASLTCGSVAFSPADATKGAPYTGQLTVPYTGGNSGTYGAQSFIVNGLTFTLPAGNFNNGSGNLLYSISGTPAVEGTTTVSITVSDKSCTNAGSLIIDAGS